MKSFHAYHCLSMGVPTAVGAGLLHHHLRGHVLQADQGNGGAIGNQALWDEIDTLETLGQHPNITQALALATLDLPGGGGDVWGLAMACCRGGSLADLPW